MHDYQPPVSLLLSYAACGSGQVQSWPNYSDEFGFTEEHIPELITLMQDQFLIDLDTEATFPELGETFDPQLAVWAPIHAWRAIGQLEAVAFLEPAIAFLKAYEIDWAWEEFPEVFELIGPPIVEPLGAAIKAEAAEDVAATILISGMQHIAASFPEIRDRCVAIMTEILQNYTENDTEVNSSLIFHLVDLQATTSIDVIEAAYQAGKVNTFHAGTWANVQIQLGLKKEADFTQEELTPEMPPALKQMHETLAKIERMRKPDAFSLGLPVDPSAFSAAKPPEFQDMQVARSATQHITQGFGNTQKSTTKNKKKKKR
ncbi:MAG: hypothetical protein AAFY20_00770 [Cyanobacteria bacterium J06639_14]